MTKEEIIEKYDIDINKLKRNYILNPLYIDKSGYNSEIPYKEDFEYLYITLNLRREDMEIFFGCSKRPIKRWSNLFNIHKSQKNMKLNMKQTRVNKIKNDATYFNKIYQKRCKTCIEKYGYINVGQFGSLEYLKSVTEHRKNPNYIININKKRNLTKTLNNSHTKSKPEDMIYKFLLLKFPKTVHHPDPSLKYPWECDFYIPELDLYIEYQGTWTHGDEPFNPLSEKHNELLLEYKQKSEEINFKGKLKNWYKDAIKTWTVRDPLKRETAKKNNLNWIEFFTMEEFYNWYDKITLQS